MKIVGTWLGKTDYPRTVAVDPAAPYFGPETDDASLTAGPAVPIFPAVTLPALIAVALAFWTARHVTSAWPASSHQ